MMKNQLKIYRAMHDLTQEQLAKKLGVTRATINAIENQRYDPSLQLAFQMAHFFNVRIEDLFLEDRETSVIRQEGTMIASRTRMDWQELNMRAQVAALRHLPPETWLPKPVHLPDRELVAQLLALPDETDPFEWLQLQHGELAARVLLWKALDTLHSMVQGIPPARRTGIPLQAGKREAWLGNLLKLQEGTEPYLRMVDTHPTTISPDLLREVFGQWRALRQAGPPLPSLEIDKDEFMPLLPLLDELFRLPETSDPLQWIQQERGHLAAYATLYHLLGEIKPPHPVLLSPQEKIDRLIRVLHPKLSKQMAGLTVEMHEIVLGKNSFTLELRTSLPIRLLQDALRPGLGIRWQAAEQVVDDLGYQYVIWQALEEGGTRWRRYELALRLVCYPALAASAREIALESKDMVIFVTHQLDERQPEILQQFPLGDLTWKIPVLR
jgi:putative transcriptional regulator